MQNIRHKRQHGSAMLLLATMVTTMMIPLTGLAIDGTIMWMIKLKLTSAMDSAALAGARYLSSGMDLSSQKAAAEATAVKYFNANFPAGYWNTTNISVTATAAEGAYKARTVTLQGTVQSPLYFMQIIGLKKQVIAAYAQSTRRDANIMLVMDRSGSLQNSGSCAPMKAAAVSFVGLFAEQRDYLGLATFASSAFYLDYPIATNFKTSSPDTLTDVINKISCVGATGSAAGLWNGYTALANLNQPGALNVIVFFTDGQPTAFSGLFPIRGTSPCTSKTAKTGVMSMTTSPSSYGLLNMSISKVPIVNDNSLLGVNTSNCSFVTNGATHVEDDVTSFPNPDYFGDNISSGYATPVNLSMTGSNATDANSIENASINAADEAARHIRKGDPITAVTTGAPAGSVGKSLSQVVIFSIGLGNTADPPQANFLMRVANDPASPNYDSSQQPGMYVYCQTASDLDAAFHKIASEILRLSK